MIAETFKISSVSEGAFENMALQAAKYCRKVSPANWRRLVTSVRVMKAAVSSAYSFTKYSSNFCHEVVTSSMAMNHFRASPVSMLSISVWTI